MERGQECVSDLKMPWTTPSLKKIGIEGLTAFLGMDSENPSPDKTTGS